ncbi:MAG TPA: hypothetical protein VF388_10065 [Lacunisphaera sp.]
MTESELRSFFADYGASFLKTEVEVASFYHVPCLTARQGKVQLNATRSECEAFFAQVLRQYRAMGSAQGEMRSLKSESHGANSTVAIITWAYKNATGQVLWESTFTYTLYKGAEGWKILLQAMHDAA